jgi:alpha-tubulin suppressor-like RCC1 family protein
VYTLGLNDKGQLGIEGEVSNLLEFHKVEICEKAVSAVYGSGFLLVLTESGVVLSCGLNNHQQLMIEGTDNQSKLQRIIVPGEAKAVYAGHSQSYVSVAVVQEAAEDRRRCQI